MPISSHPPFAYNLLTRSLFVIVVFVLPIAAHQIKGVVMIIGLMLLLFFFLNPTFGILLLLLSPFLFLFGVASPAASIYSQF